MFNHLSRCVFLSRASAKCALRTCTRESADPRKRVVNRLYRDDKKRDFLTKKNIYSKEFLTVRLQSSTSKVATRQLTQGNRLFRFERNCVGGEVKHFVQNIKTRKTR